MMHGGMMDGMDSMMAWMMGLGLLAWVLIIALLATIVVLLIRLVSRTPPDASSRGRDDPPANSRPR